MEGGGQPELERGNRSPRVAFSSKLQAGFIANQEFLELADDICQECHSQRLSPQKRHMTHLRSTRVHTENQAAGTGKAIRPKAHLGVTVLAKHLVT